MSESAKNRRFKATGKYGPMYIVDIFMFFNSAWFESKENSFYGMENKVRDYLTYWADSGKFGPDYDDNCLIYCRNRFDELLEGYEVINEK